MKCAAAVDLILEADPSVLRGEGDGRLSVHIRSCPRCRTLARTVLEEEAVLAAEMVDAVPPPDLDPILDGSLSSHSRKPGRVTIPFRKATLAVLPLAAAAVWAILFFGGQPRLPGGSYSPPPRPAGLGLEVPEGRNAAVLRTDNPDITVLWFF